MRSSLFAVCLLLAGCPHPHVVERAENAAAATAHQAALEDCLSQTAAIKKDRGKDAASAFYEKCADEADVKYGRH